MTGPGGGTIFTERVLIVRQKQKFIEVNNQYTIHDADGREIAAVGQVGQGLAKKALRFLGTPADRLLTFKLEVTDRDGAVVLLLTRPAKVMRSRVVVEDGDGNELGQIQQQNVVGKIRFSLEADGNQLAAITGKDWSRWDFVVANGDGTELAHITKSLDRLSTIDMLSSGMNDMFSTSDSYAVEILEPMDQPLYGLVVAAALGIDVALHQD